MPDQFDVIAFLNLTHLSLEDQEKAKPVLEEKIKEYLLIRILDQLPPDFEAKNPGRLQSLTQPAQLISLLKANFPDLQEKVQSILEDFRKEYHNAGK